jgi:hypothetical protein
LKQHGHQRRWWILLRRERHAQANDFGVVAIGPAAYQDLADMSLDSVCRRTRIITQGNAEDIEQGDDAMKYQCPVCGFADLSAPPTDHSIMSLLRHRVRLSGLHPASFSTETRWLSRGALWFSRTTKPPIGWNPSDQLFKANIAVEEKRD